MEKIMYFFMVYLYREGKKYTPILLFSNKINWFNMSISEISVMIFYKIFKCETNVLYILF